VFFHVCCTDLKPANVLIKGLDIKLTDFGLSHTIAINTMRQDANKLMGGAGSSAGGTALWSAPEMLEAWSSGKDAPHTPAGIY
jgi:serine/threonine protein kinase